MVKCHWYGINKGKFTNINFGFPRWSPLWAMRLSFDRNTNDPGESFLLSIGMGKAKGDM